MTPIFQIGDEVFVARAGNSLKRIVCPDCCGKKFLTVILGDDSQVTIDCAACTHSFEYSRGYIETYEWSEKADRRIVMGVRNEITDEGHKVEYVFEQGYYARHEDVFRTEVEALERAKHHTKVQEEDEAKSIQRKTKDYRSWAWNASYHRREIKDMERRIAHHKARLDVASSHAKEERKGAGRG